MLFCIIIRLDKGDTHDGSESSLHTSTNVDKFSGDDVTGKLLQHAENPGELHLYDHKFHVLS